MSCPIGRNYTNSCFSYLPGTLKHDNQCLVWVSTGLDSTYIVRLSLTCNMLSTMNYLRLVNGDHARLLTDFVYAPMECRQIEGRLLQACGQMIKYHHQERASVSRRSKVHNHYLFVNWFGCHNCKGALLSLNPPSPRCLVPACWNAVLQANIP